MAQTRYAVISQLIHPTSASQNSDFVVCRAFLAADLPPISERFLLDQWQSKISGQPVLHTILVLRLRDSLLRLPGALVLDRAPLMPISGD